MNRLSHLDWVKLCVELNYAPNQNTKIPTATNSLLQSHVVAGTYPDRYRMSKYDG